MDAETKTYEMAYLLKDLSEEELAETVQKIRKTIEDGDGLIIHENSPQKQTLAYPIKKNLTANSGSFAFIFPSGKMQALQKSFEKMNLLRFIISQTKPEKKFTRRPIKKRLIQQHPERESPAIYNGEEKIQAAREEILEKGQKIKKPDDQYKEPASMPASKIDVRGEPLQVEEIDKKLEEILGE